MSNTIKDFIDIANNKNIKDDIRLITSKDLKITTSSNKFNIFRKKKKNEEENMRTFDSFEKAITLKYNIKGEISIYKSLLTRSIRDDIKKSYVKEMLDVADRNQGFEEPHKGTRTNNKCLDEIQAMINDDKIDDNSRITITNNNNILQVKADKKNNSFFKKIYYRMRRTIGIITRKRQKENYETFESFASSMCLKHGEIGELFIYKHLRERRPTSSITKKDFKKILGKLCPLRQDDGKNEAKPKSHESDPSSHR